MGKKIFKNKSVRNPGRNTVQFLNIHFHPLYRVIFGKIVIQNYLLKMLLNRIFSAIIFSNHYKYGWKQKKKKNIYEIWLGN